MHVLWRYLHVGTELLQQPLFAKTLLARIATPSVEEQSSSQHLLTNGDLCTQQHLLRNGALCTYCLWDDGAPCTSRSREHRMRLLFRTARSGRREAAAAWKMQCGRISGLFVACIHDSVPSHRCGSCARGDPSANLQSSGW